MLINGNALAIPLADESVNCAIYSPPYWNLRVYQAGTGELGSERTIDEYIAHQVAVAKEVKRVLRSDGLAWINCGDSYNGSQKGYNGNGTWQDRSNTKQGTNVGALGIMPTNVSGLKSGDCCLIPERLALALQQDGWIIRKVIPWVKMSSCMPESVSGSRWEKHRIKVGNNGRGKENWRAAWDGDNLQQDHDGKDFKHDAQWQDCPGCPVCAPNDGLVLRRANGRPTSAHEWWIMAAKSDRYFYDAESVRRPHQHMDEARGGGGRFNDHVDDLKLGQRITYKGVETYNPNGRNWRTSDFWNDSLKFTAAQLRAEADYLDKMAEQGGFVLDTEGEPLGLMFNPEQLKMPHYAAFGEHLIAPLILASTSSRGYCPKCHAPWARVVEHDNENVSNESGIAEMLAKGVPRQKANLYVTKERGTSQTLSWRPTCSCIRDAAPQQAMLGKDWLELADELAEEFKPVPGIVFDPFVGSGTTILAARNLGRIGIGLDLSLSYLENIGLVRAEKTQTRESLAALPLFENL